MTRRELLSPEAIRRDIYRDGYVLLTGLLPTHDDEAFRRIVSTWIDRDISTITVHAYRDDPTTERLLHHDDDDAYIAIALFSKPEHDFTGGELILVEQRPRMQSRAIVVPMDTGDIAILPAGRRDAMGTKGPYRVIVRRTVGRVLSGTRHTLEARVVRPSTSP